MRNNKGRKYKIYYDMQFHIRILERNRNEKLSSSLSCGYGVKSILTDYDHGLIC